MKNSFPAKISLCCVFFATLFLFSCTPFSSPDRSVDLVEMPATFSLGEAVGAPEQQWWFVFSNARLNALVEEALAENLSLNALWARLEKVHARAAKVSSGLMPSVSGDMNASYTRSDADGENGSGSTESKNYSLGLFASYEVDLWGRVRAGVAAADLNVQASREDLNAAAMTVAAEVARRWVGIIARQNEISLLQQQLATNRTYLELIELRFRKSLASALDVMQQKQLVERVQAQIPLAEMQEQLLRNELAVLTGRMPHELLNVEPQELPVLQKPPVTGIPAQLLKNRPDVRAAMLRLKAADQDLVVAKADRLPAIRLTGSASYRSGDLDRIFDNWLLSLAASLTAPLVDGGRRKAEVDASHAAVKEQLLLYHQTVLTAVEEVEAALIREKKIREHITGTKKQLQAAETALVEARGRYVNGLNDYLPVLTQLRSVQGLEESLIARSEDLLSARISLYRATGGTWTEELSFPETVSHKQQDN